MHAYCIAPKRRIDAVGPTSSKIGSYVDRATTRLTPGYPRLLQQGRSCPQNPSVAAHFIWRFTDISRIGRTVWEAPGEGGGRDMANLDRVRLLIQ